MEIRRKTTVILGGGFAGLAAAKVLARHRETSVVLIDQRNHHLFQPLLYQVATAGLNPADIAVPIRSEFSIEDGVEVHLGKVSAVDLEASLVRVGETSVPFDHLVIACGASHSYFGRDDWEKFAPGLKTLEHATEIRRRILSAFENAENELDAELQKAYLTFAVVGGGPTGVELAGAIADISRTVLVRDFRRINPASARVILVEGGPRVLSAFDPGLSVRAENDLRELGVDVYTGTRVTEVNERGIQMGSDFVAARTVIWAAGVQATPLKFVPDVERDRAGRVRVEKDFSLKRYPHVFVVGDMAAYEVAPGDFLPGLAPVALQSGRHVARVILAKLQGKPQPDFKYRDKGIMATIGKKRAIAQAGQFKLGGILAWFAWFFIHILYLVGIKNRIAVMFHWAWSYLFSRRGARLITGVSDPHH